MVKSVGDVRMNPIDTRDEFEQKAADLCKKLQLLPEEVFLFFFYFLFYLFYLF